MMEGLRRILEMIRFSHTVFALPFALLAAVMAWTAPVEWERSLEPPATVVGASAFPEVGRVAEVGFRWRELVGILLCMVLARSAAMAFNRLADRRIDAENPRTAGRHLPAGLLSTSSVVVFTLFCCVGFVVSTLIFLPNMLPIVLSAPVLAFLLAYSYTKRFTSLAHFWLGAALMLAPVCAWIAIRGEILLRQPSDILPAVLLGGAVFCWVGGFDIIYACQDADFDTRAKLRSVPAVLGVRGALRVAAACHLITILLLLALPLVFPAIGLNSIFLTGVSAVGLLLLYEHAIVRPDDLSRINVAFFNVNALISIGLLVLGTADILL